MITEILWGTLVLSGAGILKVLQNSNPVSCEVSKCTTTATEPDTNETTTSQAYNKKDKVDYYKITYNYCSKLNLDELHEYVEYNYDLNYWDYKIYSTCSRDDKDLIVKHIAELSDKLGILFNNRFRRY